MDSILPNDLISGSVKNQKELDDDFEIWEAM